MLKENCCHQNSNSQRRPSAEDQGTSFKGQHYLVFLFFAGAVATSAQASNCSINVGQSFCRGIQQLLHICRLRRFVRFE